MNDKNKYFHIPITFAGFLLFPRRNTQKKYPAKKAGYFSSFIDG